MRFRLNVSRQSPATWNAEVSGRGPHRRAHRSTGRSIRAQMSIAAPPNATPKSTADQWTRRALDENRSIVSVLDAGSTIWCLGLYPSPAGHIRLVRRWRPKLDMSSVTFFLTMLTEPGTFIMELKMLRSICDRIARQEYQRESVGQH